MEEDEEAFDSYKVQLRLAQADSARLQENFIVALKQLSQTHGVSIDCPTVSIEIVFCANFI